MTPEEMNMVILKLTQIEADCRAMRATLIMHGALTRSESLVDPLEQRVATLEFNERTLRSGIRNMVQKAKEQVDLFPY